jgi:hypothetical protein
MDDFRFIEENGRMLNRAQYIADQSHNPDSVESAARTKFAFAYEGGDCATQDVRCQVRQNRNPNHNDIHRFADQRLDDIQTVLSIQLMLISKKQK